jgi:predicted transcriptional regulator
MSTTIRISESTHSRFARLAATTGRPMTQLVDEAVDALERRLFFEQLVSGYEALHDDDKAWADVVAERAAEAGTLGDSST